MNSGRRYLSKTEPVSTRKKRKVQYARANGPRRMNICRQERRERCSLNVGTGKAGTGGRRFLLSKTTKKAKAAR
jgi:hypothetical protein